MVTSATSRPAGAAPGLALVAARVAISAELRDAYRALGRRPAASAGRASSPPRHDPAGADNPDSLSAGPAPVGAPSERAPSQPRGGYPVRLRLAGDDPGTPVTVATTVLVSHAAAPGSTPRWTVELLMDPAGRTLARLTVALGPHGRSGTGEVALPVTSPDALRAFLSDARSSGPFSLAVSGAGTGLAHLVDCLTADGRLTPRRTR
jgi:hypothetical protein